MVIENIKTVHRSYPTHDMTRNYVTSVDSNNKRILSIVEHTFVPYNKVGKIENTDNKGTNFDKKV